MTPAGFPHSDIPGSKLVCSSPRLIAAYRVLHRLLVPRHPPCALSSLFGYLLPKVLSLCLPSVSYSVVNEHTRHRGRGRIHDRDMNRNQVSAKTRYGTARFRAGSLVIWWR